MKRWLRRFTHNPLISAYHIMIHRMKKFGACNKNFYEEITRL